MLYNHYRGANNVNNMASDAEYKLSNVHYQGEKTRWTFEKYVSLQVDQHSILNGLKDHGLATPALGTDFHWCVNLFKYFIKQSTSTQMTLDVNVSKVGTGDKYASGRGGDALEDKFYEPEEYGTFSKEQKNGLRELRLKCAAPGFSGGDGQARRRYNGNARKKKA